MNSDSDHRRALHLDLRHLRLVTAVAESGGQTRAARRLNLTQSALSHQLRELESRIGSPLFIRASRRMVLTATGERIRDRATILHEVETLERDLAAESGSGGAGIVRLATECYTLPLAAGCVTAFRQEWPHVDVRIIAEAPRTRCAHCSMAHWTSRSSRATSMSGGSAALPSSRTSRSS
jgi:LysR family transcriptional regulator for metE and metH